VTSLRTPADRSMSEKQHLKYSIANSGQFDRDVKPRGSASSRGSLEAIFSSLGLGLEGYCLSLGLVLLTSRGFGNLTI